MQHHLEWGITHERVEREAEGNIEDDEGRYWFGPCHVDIKAFGDHVDPCGGLQRNSTFSEGAIPFAPRLLLPETDAENILCVGFGGDEELGGERPRTEEEGGQPSHVDQRDTSDEVDAAEEGLAALSREESGHEAGDHNRGAGRSEAEVSREEVAADQRKSGAATGEHGAAATGHQSSQRWRRRRSSEGGGERSTTTTTTNNNNGEAERPRDDAIQEFAVMAKARKPNNNARRDVADQR
ncbi:hypothetical protein Syun_019527 [Stephania yunnanensis]|uniref:Uncharacterized protein n=1 Tax=Stephania yunnanensis TaxID=152371 RepID=A0AAP0IV10_9MAGN